MRTLSLRAESGERRAKSQKRHGFAVVVRLSALGTLLLAVSPQYSLATPLVPDGLAPGETYQLVFVTDDPMEHYDTLQEATAAVDPGDGLAWYPYADWLGEFLLMDNGPQYEMITADVLPTEPLYDFTSGDLLERPTRVAHFYSGETIPKPTGVWVYGAIFEHQGPGYWPQTGWQTTTLPWGGLLDQELNHFVVYSEVLTVPVPEPSTLLLVAIAAQLVVLRRRMRLH